VSPASFASSTDSFGPVVDVNQATRRVITVSDAAAVGSTRTSENSSQENPLQSFLKEEDSSQSFGSPFEDQTQQQGVVTVPVATASKFEDLVSMCVPTDGKFGWGGVAVAQA
jgi:hypothetical protein